MRKIVVVLAVLTLVFVTAPVDAQQPAAPTDSHHPAPAAAPAVTATPPSGGMMPMNTCHDMMSGMMGMMGMPMGQQPSMDPKMRGQMMEMHGEMMKAMGDIMMKHAKKMQAPR